MATKAMTKAERYQELIRSVDSALEGEHDPVVWMATVAALIKEQLGFLWVGFYRAAERGLVIGPYQGSLGCLHIDYGKGVCGACAARRETVVVADVEEFPGHITCDPRSRSEIVVPILNQRGDLVGVLDVDSDRLGAFDDQDRHYLESLATRMRGLKWSPAP